MAQQHADPHHQALALYAGNVMHARLKPVVHRFTYAMTSVLIDLDQLDNAAKASPFFSVNRRNLIAFHERHHGPRDGSPLRPYIDALLARAGSPRPSRIRLLCYPTVLGHTFNPLSVYFCEDAEGSITALVYQVHNTFGQSHIYVAPICDQQFDRGVIRQERNKGFYVSPFMDMAMTYRFRVSPPAETVALRILELDEVSPILSAAFFGRYKAANSKSLLTAVLKTCGITWKVTVGIHWEALRLWLKGMKLKDMPSPPPEASFPEGGEMPGRKRGETIMAGE